ncbi:hypothetical protein K438DRAFT_1856293 [Mycena galopus ATCC 62051]|nr:hypothetical protein K438DRAFT_1856293 [Mycena galopus ATCC 62051]
MSIHNTNESTLSRIRFPRPFLFPPPSSSSRLPSALPSPHHYPLFSILSGYLYLSLSLVSSLHPPRPLSFVLCPLLPSLARPLLLLPSSSPSPQALSYLVPLPIAPSPIDNSAPWGARKLAAAADRPGCGHLRLRRLQALEILEIWESNGQRLQGCGRNVSGSEVQGGQRRRHPHESMRVGVGGTEESARSHSGASRNRRRRPTPIRRAISTARAWKHLTHCNHAGSCTRSHPGGGSTGSTSSSSPTTYAGPKIAPRLRFRVEERRGRCAHYKHTGLFTRPHSVVLALSSSSTTTHLLR